MSFKEILKKIESSKEFKSFKKENPNPEIKRTVLKDWAWGNPNYFFEIDKSKTTIKKITIDPSGLMADVKPENNSYEIK
jgi:hypothetical protein